MSKEIKFTMVVGNPHDIRAEFWLGDSKVESKWLTADEEDGLSELIDFGLVRQGTVVSMSAEDVQRAIDEGEVMFMTDDGDWTNFEAILYDIMKESE